MHEKLKDTGKRKKPEQEISSFVPSVERAKKYVILTVSGLAGETVDVYSGEDYLLTATLGKKGDVKIGKETDIAYHILENPSIVTLRIKSDME